MRYAIHNITNNDTTTYTDHAQFEAACRAAERDGDEFRAGILYWFDGHGYVSAERASRLRIF